MKKISAAFMILAVLNPLCCCLTFVNGIDSPVDDTNSHDCCAGESESKPAKGHGAQDCPHKMLLDEDARIAQDQHSPSLSTPSSIDQVVEVLDLATLRNNPQPVKVSYLSAAVVDFWIRTQTNCVRLL